ncbi:MAG TPA: ComEC/Rec2 family competence protein [Candidatus Paceibacterota bacterium]|nr:ComEC/Rec2 family competence protein [Candidatus Paceibacterota bacterium]
MHKSRIFGCFLASFLAGVFVGSFVSQPTYMAIGLTVAGALVFAVCLYHKTFEGLKDPELARIVGFVVSISLLCAAVGVFRYGFANAQQSVLMEFAREAGGKGIEVTVHGYLAADPDISGSSAELLVRVKDITVPSRTVFADENMLVTTDAYPGHTLGDQLAITGALKLPQNAADSDFDYVQYLKNKSIRTIMIRPKIEPGPAVLSWAERATIAVYRPLLAIKHSFEHAVRRSLAEPVASYIDGILLGSRQNIPDSIQDAFQKTSTTHILAISGYNIAIIAESLLAIAVVFTKRRNAFWISTIVIILFTILTGASASVVRAAVMGLLLLAANGYGRLYDPRNSILCAAAVMVWLNPLALRFDVGFQLSFLAVLGMIFLYPVLERKFQRVPEAGGLKETILMAGAAQLAVAPILAYTFHSFSIVSLPTNLIVLPLMPYVMLFGFAAGVAGWLLVPFGQLVGWVVWALAKFQIAVISWFAALPFASVTISIHWLTMAALYALLGWWVWRNRSRFPNAPRS